jgi:hypothetical protein
VRNAFSDFKKNIRSHVDYSNQYLGFFSLVSIAFAQFNFYGAEFLSELGCRLGRSILDSSDLRFFP